MSFQVPDQIAGFSVFPVELDKQTRLVEPSQVDRLEQHVREVGVTDLLVVAHGWNNDKQEALTLYAALLDNIAAQRRDRWDGRTVAVLAVFWPSKRFADEDLIPGGAASLGGDVPLHDLQAQLAELQGFFDPPDADAILVELSALVPRLEGERAARDAFGDLARRLVGLEPSTPTDADPAAAADVDDAGTDVDAGAVPVTADPEVRDEVPVAFLRLSGSEVLDALSYPRPEELAAASAVGSSGDPVGGGSSSAIGGVGMPSFGGGTTGTTATGGTVTGGTGGAPGEAAFLGSAFRGVRSGARQAMNLVTYYAMKRRAGEVGQHGLAPVLRRLRDASPALGLHLVGHSFGGRLVVAAALGADGDPPLPVDSATLLQAAFSHHGFAEGYEAGKDGFFRRVLSEARISGPLVVTHTHNDRANTWAYPMASRLARQVAAAFGGPDDRYGAIGSNGALSTPGARMERLLAADGTYAFVPGGTHNLEASTYVHGHGDVTGVEIANAVVAAVAGASRTSRA